MRLGGGGIISIPVSSGSSLPSGVTLQAIDGETMLTSTTMSNNYYSRNGFSVAATPITGSGAGSISWDNPAFFPMGCFFGIYQDQLSTFQALNFNTSWAITDDAGQDTFLVSNGIWGLPGWDPASAPAPAGAAEPGIWLDEPNSIESGGVYPSVTDAIATPTPAQQAGRFWHLNCTHGQIYAGGINISGSSGAPPNMNMMKILAQTDPWSRSDGSKTNINSFSCDVYWFASRGNETAWEDQGLEFILSIPMGGSPTLTTYNIGLGSNYGNLIDCYRSFANGTNTYGISADTTPGDGAYGTSGATSPIPFVGVYENGVLYDSMGWSAPITPPEMVWAHWSSIIHGARGICVFDVPSNYETTIQSGQTVSQYTQGVITNGLTTAVAKILNSPFALGYCTVSPHGYLFPIYEQNWLNGGIELCVHWFNGTTFTNSYGTFAPGFYIFATTRYGEADNPINQSATFTVNDPNATSVKVIYSTDGNQGDTIAISGGTFTDTFTNSYSVRIYQVNG